jgi:hypothetical protein
MKYFLGYDRLMDLERNCMDEYLRRQNIQTKNPEMTIIDSINNGLTNRHDCSQTSHLSVKELY